MYLSLGQSAVVPTGEIVGIFDLDNTSWAFKTREFLERAEQEGRAVWLTDGLPRSFVLCRDGRLYITPLSAGVLRGRAETGIPTYADVPCARVGEGLGPPV